jgi:hypothetical protein
MTLCTKEKVEADRRNMISILEKWKQNQDSARPLLVLLNTSGGGHRSATFTVSMLQALDSLTHGAIMKKIFLITGASGGMVGATYFRELYLQRLKGKWLVLFFYPADFTFVCPTEVTGFGRMAAEFRAEQAEVIGVSVDSIDSHRKWADELGGVDCPLYGDREVPAKYFLWVKTLDCESCHKSASNWVSPRSACDS